MNGAGPGDNASPETQDKRHGAIQTTLGYAGMFYHARSGLYLTHYRAYDPRLGRWLSRDPIWESGGVNLYGCVGGDPVSFVDPYGLFGIGDLPDIPQPVVDYTAGFGDAASFGLTNLIREAMDANDAVDKCSIYYSVGSWTTAVLGAGRLTYAGLVKGYSQLASSGAAASAFRSQLRRVFGGGPSLRPPNLARYTTDDALRAAAGRTNPYANTYGLGTAGAGAYGGSRCNCN
jgi:RHS repeat-associated protein